MALDELARLAGSSFTISGGAGHLALWRRHFIGSSLSEFFTHLFQPSTQSSIAEVLVP